MSMVKIDGTKIKRLREKQGLTQLYLATAVEVTTDTISRWENRRYPSIKMENGLKLAEALGIELEDILEIEDVKTIEAQIHTQAKDTIVKQAITSEAKERSVHVFKLPWPLLILSATLFIIIFGFLFSYFNMHPGAYISAERIAPGHSVAGQPLPVLIKVTDGTDDTTAIIIKEEIPDGGNLISNSPKTTGKSGKNREIKWLKKVRGETTFAYVITISGANGQDILLKGTIANSGELEKVISGSSKIVISNYHWADSNQDNVISDKEILIVYDLYSEIKNLNLDIDAIEEMWLGSGYRWNQDSDSFKVID